ncbi:MAG: sulfur carrier protein ThiS [Hyphomicrobiaceae bacterium]
MLELTINGERQAVEAVTLDAALIELGFGSAKVATALNGNFVPVGRRAGVLLKAGDRIEIVTARQGG